MFNTLCDGYCKLKEVDSALKVLEDMKRLNIKRSAVIYTTLVKMFWYLGNEAKVFEMMNEMKSEGIKATILIYTSLDQVLNWFKKTDEFSVCITL